MKSIFTVLVILLLVGCAAPMTHERYAPCDAYEGNCQPMVKMNVWD